MIRTTAYGAVTRFDLARTIAGRGRYWTTCYLVDGMLIDTGCAHTSSEMVRLLKQTPLRRIVNTHTHEDHIGSNGPLQRHRPGLEILAHPLALPVLADPARKQPLHPYRRLFWGWPEPSQAAPLHEGDIVETEHYRFEVLDTPGHSPDHICLYEKDRGWLFSGDLYVGGRDRALRHGYDIWQVIASLKLVACLPLCALYPGAARVPAANPRRVLQEKIDYLEDLGDRVLELDRRGHPSSEIARALLGGPMWIEYATLGHFSRLRLVNSYLGKNSE